MWRLSLTKHSGYCYFCKVILRCFYKIYKTGKYWSVMSTTSVKASHIARQWDSVRKQIRSCKFNILPIFVSSRIFISQRKVFLKKKRTPARMPPPPYISVFMQPCTQGLFSCLRCHKPLPKLNRNTTNLGVCRTHCGFIDTKTFTCPRLLSKFWFARPAYSNVKIHPSKYDSNIEIWCRLVWLYCLFFSHGNT
jgi:hypothetical protein